MAHSTICGAEWGGDDRRPGRVSRAIARPAADSAAPGGPWPGHRIAIFTVFSRRPQHSPKAACRPGLTAAQAAVKITGLPLLPGVPMTTTSQIPADQLAKLANADTQRLAARMAQDVFAGLFRQTVAVDAAPDLGLLGELAGHCFQERQGSVEGYGG